MTETIAPVAKPVSRPRSRKPASVSASALALHLDCRRTYIGKLEAEGVIQRQGYGFLLDQNRVESTGCPDGSIPVKPQARAQTSQARSAASPSAIW